MDHVLDFKLTDWGAGHDGNKVCFLHMRGIESQVTISHLPTSYRFSRGPWMTIDIVADFGYLSGYGLLLSAA